MSKMPFGEMNICFKPQPLKGREGGREGGREREGERGRERERETGELRRENPKKGTGMRNPKKGRKVMLRKK